MRGFAGDERASARVSDARGRDVAMRMGRAQGLQKLYLLQAGRFPETHGFREIAFCVCWIPKGLDSAMVFDAVQEAINLGR